jgi:probable phosphoglycerate mutase
MVAMGPARDADATSGALRSIEAAFLLDPMGRALEGATEVWLVRHADCYLGLDGDAAEDPPLSALGREQAALLAARARRLALDAVYSSPLRRALETAHVISEHVDVDERLREVGTTVQDGRLSVAEPLEQVRERMRAAVADAVAAHPGGRVLMVGHALAILAYLCDVLRLEFGSLRLLPYFTSVSVVRVMGDRQMVGSLADIAHLEA